MHSIFYNYAPVSFRNVWNRNEEREAEVSLRNNNLFRIPYPRIELFKRLPLYSLPFEWNNSDVLIYYENQITFKYALRETL